MIIDDYKAEIASLTAEVERLRTELILAKPLYSRRQLEARASSAEAQVERLRAALEPFAKKGDAWIEWRDDFKVGDYELSRQKQRVNAVELIAARTALQSTDRSGG